MDGAGACSEACAAVSHGLNSEVANDEAASPGVLAPGDPSGGSHPPAAVGRITALPLPINSEANIHTVAPPAHGTTPADVGDDSDHVRTVGGTRRSSHSRAFEEDTPLSALRPRKSVRLATSVATATAANAISSHVDVEVRSPAPGISWRGGERRRFQAQVCLHRRLRMLSKFVPHVVSAVAAAHPPRRRGWTAVRQVTVCGIGKVHLGEYKTTEEATAALVFGKAALAECRLSTQLDTSGADWTSLPPEKVPSELSKQLPHNDARSTASGTIRLELDRW